MEFEVDLSLDDRQANQIIHVTRAGEGVPLLLVHGFPLDSRMWKNQIATLAGRFDVIVPDLRGFGRSTALPNQGWQMADFAADLSSLLERLEIGQPVVFCGLSMGGYIAFEFVRHFPDRVRHLVLCNTRPESDDERTARGRRVMAHQVMQEGTKFVRDSMLPRLISSQSPISDSDRTLLEEMFSDAKSESVARGQLAMAERNDFSQTEFWQRQSPSGQAKVNLPVTLIAGSEDVITPAREMEALASRIDNANFHRLENCGHLTPLESPAEFNSIVQDLSV